MTHRTLLVLFLLCASTACRGDGEPSQPYARDVADAIPRIEEAMGLEFRSPPTLESRSREQVRQFVEAQFNERQPAAQLAGEEIALKRLGLIPDSMDLRDFLLDLYAEQIAGYYDPETKVLYVVDGADETIARITIRHELIHALQDQYVDLDSIQQSRDDSDRLTAAMAVIEGQATYESMQVELGGSLGSRLPGGWDAMRDLIRQQSAQMPVFSRAPLVIQETAVFPYLSGAEFVRRFEERAPDSSLFARFPVSTEQVMHPAAFESVPPDTPTRVTLGSPRGGTRVHDDALGEFGTRIFLFEHLRDQNAAVRGAAGWDGDRYMIVRTAGGDALVWLSVWDTPLDAGEFGDLAKQTAARRFGRNGERTIPGGTEFTSAGRVVRITGGELRGRPYVLYLDVPAGAPTTLIDPARVELAP